MHDLFVFKLVHRSMKKKLQIINNNLHFDEINANLDAFLNWRIFYIPVVQQIKVVYC